MYDHTTEELLLSSLNMRSDEGHLDRISAPFDFNPRQLYGNATIQCIRVLFQCYYYAWQKVKFSHTRFRVLGPELILVYRQSARR